MAGYLPNSDAELLQWIRTFFSYVGAHTAALGLTEDELAALTAAKPLWENAYNAHLTAQNAAQAARLTKDEKRTDVLAAIRPLVNRIQSYSGTTDADRLAMGITVRSAQMESTSTEVLDDMPVPVIDVRNHLIHAIRVKNKIGTDIQKARPSWATGCEVWHKVGATPSGPSDVQYIGTVTRGARVIGYEPDDGGKQAHYLFRWVGSNGEVGPWSDVASATIAA